MTPHSNILIYQTEDGQTKIQTRLKDETVWLTQEQMAELFQRDRTVISKHIKNIFQEKELDENMVCAKLAHTTKHGAIENKTQTSNTNFYNLDVIISVGYRVKSLQGTKFRQWATARLKEYIVKGFTMNDELLKQAGGGNYFEELLERIRDIRSSEKVFWRKVLDIYATSIDYDPKAESSMLFFQTVQNKMHWAVHGNTAAEIVYQRADSTKPNMGLTNFKGSKPTKQEAEIAKNYLNVDELTLLNRMVTAYIEMAEIQAMSKTPMYMKDWIARLDDFLKMTGKDILSHAGAVSHEKAIQKVNEEYMSYKERTKDELSHVEEDFIAYLETTVKILKNKSKK
ncbi:virulence RhuM family protein [Sulfurimonas sp.]|uniref:virulence RhuM family protein n=1 Tax=Sulfurimonas sp. TaxID=2022749 RepID=UPI0026147610|nr:virulence RhuM family protein [Sulfurimonas sp.]MDD3855446.1 virulence RhuM family protein [Sulfurimonas sp.]